MAIEARKHLIVTVKFGSGSANDSPDFPRALKKVRLTMLPVKLVVADKGYDAASNHEYAQDALGTRTAIPVRAANRPKIKMRRKRRKKQVKDFNKEVYDGQRPKVEKRKIGAIVLARDSSQQRKEPVFSALVYKGVRGESLSALHRGLLYSRRRHAHEMLAAPNHPLPQQRV